MKVKAKRSHANVFGDKYAKSKDDSYDHPDPSADITAGLVEAESVTDKAPQKASKAK